MRLYTFTNYYLNTISQGIQPAHCLGELFMKYQGPSQEQSVLHDYAKNHKTMICLNGGDYHGVLDCANQLERFGDALGLPYANFHEDQQSLGGLMTCCGIVVPTHIYEASSTLRGTPLIDAIVDDRFRNWYPPEIELAVFLTQFGLAK